MSNEISFGEIQMGVSMDRNPGGTSPGGTFRIGILGDFSGRANRGIGGGNSDLAARPVRMVDRDNIETLLETVGAQLDRTVAGPDDEPISISFKELDDFHPDRLYDRLELFAKLRQLRRQLAKPSSFETAAAVVEGWLEAPQAVDPPPAAVPPPVAADEPMSLDNLLDQTLDATDLEPRREAPELTMWHRLIHDIAAPFALPKIGPRQQELTACVDEAIARAMSGVVHHPDFQSLEASWRCLDLLVRRLETDESLKVFLIDVSKQELESDLNAQDDLAQSGLYRLLVEKTLHTPGGHAWNLLVGDYSFGTDERDIRLLGRLGQVADASGAPLIAAASGDVVGCESPSESQDPDEWQPASSPGWSSLRSLPASRSIALTWPRFLARLPYGKRSRPIESFDYEELSERSPHGHFLWGNAAYLTACMIGQAYTQSGWSLRPGEINEVPGVPLYLYESDGETAVRPCGEVLLSERGVRIIVDQGLIPVLSVRDQDIVRIQAFHTLSDPPQPLKLGG